MTDETIIEPGQRERVINSNGLKIVRIRNPEGFRYSLRWADSEGVETEIVVSGQEAECRAYEKAVRQIELRPDAAKLAVMLAATLITIGQLALRIQNAGDQAGVDGYATKHHMRAWARDIVYHVGAALDHTGAFPSSTKKSETTE